MKRIHVERLCARPPKGESRKRRSGALTAVQRTLVLAKTAGTCHVCGDSAGPRWQADHVIHHHLGKHSVDNYLPVCRQCNRLRWSHRPEVLRLILLLGTYAKREIRHKTALGQELAALLVSRVNSSQKRRVIVNSFASGDPQDSSRFQATPGTVKVPRRAPDRILCS